MQSNTPIDPDEILMDSISLRGGDTVEAKIERPLSSFSSFAFFVIAAAGFLYLFLRAEVLQVASGEDLFLKSQENRFLTRPLFPPRGTMYDRNREPIVENVPSFGLVFEKAKFIKARARISDVRARLGKILKKDEAYFYENGFPREEDLATAREQIFILRDLSVPQVVALTPALDLLPGIQIVENYKRVYRDPFQNSHIVGYIGKISPEDIKKNPMLEKEESVGKSGIEGFYDQALRGTGGKKIVEANSRGIETQFKLLEKPEEGLPLVLTIDEGLQKIAYDLIESYTEGKKGASAVIIDPQSGAVRALVSYPGFDINSFSSALGAKEFQQVLRDPLTPLFNRAIAGEFPSGSTIKPLIASAALQERIIDPNKKIYDEGFITVSNPYHPEQAAIFKDWRKHGWVNMYDAIAVSANVYFYTIGGGYKDQGGLGIERIKKYAELFGLGARLGIDIPGERPGMIPDPDTKKASGADDGIWRIGDTYNVSIGQGGVKVTPLQMTALTAAIANGGKLYKPYLVQSVLDREGKVEKEMTTVLIREKMVGKEALREVVHAMRQTVTSGTARRLADLPVSVGAKTGTAQAGAGLPHAWVTAFAPVENPEIAITVMVEHAGEGSTVAVPITREILNWYFTHKK